LFDQSEQFFDHSHQKPFLVLLLHGSGYRSNSPAQLLR
jgi:hypothetical protein